MMIIVNQNCIDYEIKFLNKNCEECEMENKGECKMFNKKLRLDYFFNNGNKFFRLPDCKEYFNYSWLHN
jgi:hypothetical protein